MAYQVTEIVRRCQDANENDKLGLATLKTSKVAKLTNFLLCLISDLSECSLMSVPDAVYHLMRNTELKSCDLSGNVISKISPKFAAKFSLITGRYRDERMTHFVAVKRFFMMKIEF